MQNRYISKSKTGFSRTRITILYIIVFFIAIVFEVRLIQIGVIKHDQYSAMASGQYYIEREIPSRRGQIYAQDVVSGELYPIATNIEKYEINIIPRNVKNKREASNQLAKLLELDEIDLYQKVDNDKLYLPPIAKKVEKEVADKIIDLKLTGVVVTTEDIRYYPEGALAGQTLGFVNNEGDGQYGVEGYYNNELQGKSGVVTAQKDTFGRLISQDTSEAVNNGSDLVLTIEHNVQYVVEQKLVDAMAKFEADDGSIVIMDPKTGGILALAAAPGYDPNEFGRFASDDQQLFINPTISYVWEPGSIFKPVIMGTALDLGKLEPDTEDVFSNMTVVQGYEIHTAQDKAFGRETMTQVLENSDNVAMVWVADKIGNDDMYKYITSFGFASKTGIDLQGEVEGSLLKSNKWKDINRATISFGQGISITPLQLVTAYGAIANGGILLKPHIIDKIVEPDGSEIKIQTKQVRQVVSEETAAKLTTMLVSVVERGHGKKAGVAGYNVAGKTGTAQVPNPEGGYYEDRHVGSFAGFFPADDPKFVMLVKLNNPKNVEWAESSAAPLFGDLAQWLLNYYEIPPTKE